jgi:hypothetical protein
MDQIEEQAISDTKVTAPTGTFSEVGKCADAKAEATMIDEQDEKPFTETKATGHAKGGSPRLAR